MGHFLLLFDITQPLTGTYSAIGRILGVNRVTVKNFVESRGLKE